MNSNKEVKTNPLKMMEALIKGESANRDLKRAFEYLKEAVMNNPPHPEALVILGQLIVLKHLVKNKIFPNENDFPLLHPAVQEFALREDNIIYLLEDNDDLAKAKVYLTDASRLNQPFANTTLLFIRDHLEAPRNQQPTNNKSGTDSKNADTVGEHSKSSGAASASSIKDVKHLPLTDPKFREAYKDFESIITRGRQSDVQFDAQLSYAKLIIVAHLGPQLYFNDKRINKIVAFEHFKNMVTTTSSINEAVKLLRSIISNGKPGSKEIKKAQIIFFFLEIIINKIPILMTNKNFLELQTEAQSGNVESLAQLGKFILLKKPSLGLKLLKIAAARGNITAKFYLFECYSTGVSVAPDSKDSIQPDAKIAKHHLLAAAHEGHGGANYEVYMRANQNLDEYKEEHDKRIEYLTVALDANEPRAADERYRISLDEVQNLLNAANKHILPTWEEMEERAKEKNAMDEACIKAQQDARASIAEVKSISSENVAHTKIRKKNKRRKSLNKTTPNQTSTSKTITDNKVEAELARIRSEYQAKMELLEQSYAERKKDRDAKIAAIEANHRILQDKIDALDAKKEKPLDIIAEKLPAKVKEPNIQQSMPAPNIKKDEKLEAELANIKTQSEDKIKRIEQTFAIKKMLLDARIASIDRNQTQIDDTLDRLKSKREMIDLKQEEIAENVQAIKQQLSEIRSNTITDDILDQKQQSNAARVYGDQRPVTFFANLNSLQQRLHGYCSSPLWVLLRNSSNPRMSCWFLNHDIRLNLFFINNFLTIAGHLDPVNFITALHNRAYK